MKKIVVFGAGGFGREVKMLIDQINRNNNQYELLGFYDDGIAKNTRINGFNVIGNLNDLLKIDFELSVVISIANPRIKKIIHNKLKKNLNLNFPCLIHPNVLIGNDEVNIGEGSIICASNIITVNVKIGKFVLVNLGCTIGHDSKIGDYCSLMPTVNISGEVTLYEMVFIGTGAKIINLKSVGSSTIIGAGAVVSKSLPPNCTAVGIPAKPIKFNNEE